jgi:hypothetical protein
MSIARKSARTLGTDISDWKSGKLSGAYAFFSKMRRNR